MFDKILYAVFSMKFTYYRRLWCDALESVSADHFLSNILALEATVVTIWLTLQIASMCVCVCVCGLCVCVYYLLLRLQDGCEVLSVYTSVCLSKTACSDFTKFSIHVTRGRRLVFLWLQCNSLCTSGFMDDVMFSRSPNGPDILVDRGLESPT